MGTYYKYSVDPVYCHVIKAAQMVALSNLVGGGNRQLNSSLWKLSRVSSLTTAAIEASSHSR